MPVSPCRGLLIFKVRYCLEMPVSLSAEGFEPICAPARRGNFSKCGIVCRCPCLLAEGFEFSKCGIFWRCPCLSAEGFEFSNCGLFWRCPCLSAEGFRTWSSSRGAFAHGVPRQLSFVAARRQYYISSAATLGDRAKSPPKLCGRCGHRELVGIPLETPKAARPDCR